MDGEKSSMEKLKATDIQPLRSRSVALIVLDAGIIFVLLLFTYCLTYSGSFRIDDEHILVARAQSLAFWDQIQYPQVYGNDRVRHLSTVSDEVASPVVAIEPGQALLGSFLFLLASATSAGGVQAYFTMNLYATAVTGALVYLCVHVLGYRRRTAILTALMYGFGTMAWPYSKTAFRDPLAATMVAMMMLGWILWKERVRVGRYAGLFLFMIGVFGSLSFKANSLAFLPAFLISAVILSYQNRKSAGIDKSWFLFGLFPLILLIILSLFVSNPGPLSRFSFSYYLESLSNYFRDLSLQTLLATLGPFFSPAKSLFLFNPVFLLIPWILVRNWRKLPPIALPAMLGILFLALFQALHLREHWAGTLVWGLRFMLPILPLVSLLLAPWLDGLISNGINRKDGLSFALIGLSTLVQLSGAVVAWRIPFEGWLAKGLDPYSPGSIWRLEYLVIPQHLQALFHISSWDIAWFRTLQTQSWVILLPIFALVSIILAVTFLRKRDVVIWRSRYRSVIAIFLTTFGICFPVFPSLRLLREDPSAGGESLQIEQIVDWTQAEAREGDLIVVDSYGTDLWTRMMNDWHQPVPWYSLPYEIPGTEGVGSEIGGNPSPSTQELFGRLEDGYTRLIYLTSQETPDYVLLREEHWLQTHYDLQKEVEFNGEPFVKACIFSSD
jgi:hypothetical protein